MTKALETADIPWSTYSNYCTENPEYPKKIDELKALLKQNAQEVAEKALERLIEANVDNPKMFQQVERLARWILEKRRREDYGEEKPQLPGGGNVNYGIQISLEKATTDQLRRITRGEDPKSVLEETQPVK